MKMAIEDCKSCNTAVDRERLKTVLKEVDET